MPLWIIFLLSAIIAILVALNIAHKKELEQMSKKEREDHERQLEDDMFTW